MHILCDGDAVDSDPPVTVSGPFVWFGRRKTHQYFRGLLDADGTEGTSSLLKWLMGFALPPMGQNLVSSTVSCTPTQ